MYIGNKDPEVSIIVPQSFCNTYDDDFVHICIPPEKISDYQVDPASWKRMSIVPTQVDALRKINMSPYNVIRVPDGVQIVCAIKEEQYEYSFVETLLPEDIIGRFLKYYRYLLYVDTCFENDCMDDLDTNSFDLYLDMLHTGQSMDFYMNRLPRCL